MMRKSPGALPSVQVVDSHARLLQLCLSGRHLGLLSCAQNSKIDSFLYFSFLTHLKYNEIFHLQKLQLSLFFTGTNHLITLACKGICADSVISSPLAPTNMAF